MNLSPRLHLQEIADIILPNRSDSPTMVERAVNVVCSQRPGRRRQRNARGLFHAIGGDMRTVIDPERRELMEILRDRLRELY